MGKLNLPKGYEITERTYGVRFSDGASILHDYCSLCQKKGKCISSKTLSHAMGDNFPFWAKEFIFVEVPTEYNDFQKSEIKVMCANYKSSQQKLNLGLKSHDGVERLIELAKFDEKKYLEEHPNTENNPLSGLEIGTITNID